MEFINGLPLEFNEFNLITSMKSPSTVHCKNTVLTSFFYMYLIESVMSVYEFTLPDSIDSHYFKWVLFCNGWIIGTYDDDFGAIAHYGKVSGRDWYLRPKECEIILTDTDPTKSLTISRTLQGENKNAVIISLRENFRPITDLVMFYAEQLSLLFESFDMNIINSKLAYVFGTDNKALAQTFYKLFDNIAEGNPCCVVDKDLFSDDYTPRWQAFFNNIKSNFVGEDLLLCVSKIKKMFLTDIGIPNANTDKKERATDDEINSNNLECLTRVEMWRDNINKGFEELQKLNSDWLGSECRLRTQITPEISGIIKGVSDDDFIQREGE